jgi:hypothetical protein
MKTHIIASNKIIMCISKMLVKTMVSYKGVILIFMTLLTLNNAQSIYLIPDKDILTPSDIQYTVYIVPEISFTSASASTNDFALTYSSQMNTSHIWVTFTIPTGLNIEYKYNVYLDVLDSGGNTIATDTFKFIIAKNLSDEDLWDLWDQYEEYEEIIIEQEETIGNLTDDVEYYKNMSVTSDEKSVREQLEPFFSQLTIFLAGALTISFIAFMGYTRMKEKYIKTEEKLINIQDNFTTELEQNRTGSMSLLATKPAGDGRPVSILGLAEERGAVKMLRDDPELPDFLQVNEDQNETSSLDHLKNLLNTDVYTTVYKDNVMFQLHCLNGIIKYCHNYGFTGHNGSLYPKHCTLEDIEHYRDEIHYKIRQYSDIGKYVPVAKQEEELKRKVKDHFGKLPEV